MKTEFIKKVAETMQSKYHELAKEWCEEHNLLSD